jgi:predicted nucleic acid-binding protein
MILIDTSLLIPIFRDASGAKRRVLRSALRGREFVLSRFNQLELLQGAADEEEWSGLNEYLANQVYAETADTTWQDGARMFFELRRKGKTVRSVIDCMIAQICIEQKLTLFHNDRDFETVATFFKLREQRLQI